MSKAIKAALIATLLLGALGCATPAPAPNVEQVNGYLQVAERIDPRVHVLRQANANFAGVVGNVTIIEQSQGLVLVDSGSSRGDGERVVAAVRRISSKPVTAVIITHWHNDHPLGLPAIVAAWPNVQIISTTTTLDLLRNGLTTAPLEIDPAWETRRVATLEGYRPELDDRIADASLSQAERDGWARARSAIAIRTGDVSGTRVILPNRTFTDRLLLDDPVAPVEARFEGRANTDGDAVIWLSRQRILIAGDAVVSPAPYLFSIHTTENLVTLERLDAIPFTTLVPGHGQVQHDHQYLELLIAFTRDVQAQVIPLAARGLTLEAVTEQVNADAYAQRFVGDDPWLRYWFQRYSLAPLIDSAYREAKGEVFEPS